MSEQTGTEVTRYEDFYGILVCEPEKEVPVPVEPRHSREKPGKRKQERKFVRRKEEISMEKATYVDETGVDKR